MHAFFYVRFIAHIILFLLNALLLGFAGAAVANCHHVAVTVPAGLVLIVVAAVLTLVLVPLALCGLWLQNAFFSRVWFEVSWVCLLAIVHFSATISLTTAPWSLFCHITSAVSSSDNLAGTLDTAPCARYLSLVSLSWVSSLILLTIALSFLAMSVGHACITSRLWRADIAEVDWFPSAEPRSAGPRKSKARRAGGVRPTISKPIPFPPENDTEKWCDVDLEVGSTSTRGGGVEAPEMQMPERVQTRFSRFSLYRIVQNIGNSKVITNSPARPPTWARNARGRPGVDPAFPARRAQLPPPLPVPVPVFTTHTLPPTPVTTRPANPEPPTPSEPTTPSEPPTPPPKTLTRQITELELAFVFDAGGSNVLPKAQTPRSVRSYASTDYPLGSSFGTTNPLGAVSEELERSWLDLPPLGDDGASSVYSQPSIPPGTRRLAPKKSEA